MVLNNQENDDTENISQVTNKIFNILDLIKKYTVYLRLKKF